MDGNDQTKDAARQGSAARTAGVTATAIALFAVAIFLGTRHAGHAAPPAAAPPVASVKPPEVVAAPPASPAAPTVKLPPRRLEEANRRELVTTLPKEAPIDVTANDRDPEAFRLAQEIHAFLIAKGYQVAEVTRSISTPTAKGVGLEKLPGGRWRVIVGAAEE